MKLNKIAELRMKHAEREGKLKGLEGEGQPLRDKVSDNSIEGFGYGAMSEAGVLPEEIELRKAIERQKRLLTETSDAESKTREMAKLSELQLKLSLQEEARRKYFS